MLQKKSPISLCVDDIDTGDKVISSVSSSKVGTNDVFANIHLKIDYLLIIKMDTTPVPVPVPDPVPVFIDDNTIYDTMPYLECPECRLSQLYYNDALSSRVNANRLAHFLKTDGVESICMCSVLALEQFFASF